MRGLLLWVTGGLRLFPVGIGAEPMTTASIRAQEAEITIVSWTHRKGALALDVKTWFIPIGRITALALVELFVISAFGVLKKKPCSYPLKWTAPCWSIFQREPGFFHQRIVCFIDHPLQGRLIVDVVGNAVLPHR